MRSRSIVALIGIAALIAGCDFSRDGADDGKTFLVKEAHNSAALVLKEAKRRGLKHSLSKPFAVSTANGSSLYTVSWADAETSDLDWYNVSDEKLLDRMALRINSADGMLPFYAYCFGGDNRAQTATKFCTRTLISAMTQAEPAKK